MARENARNRFTFRSRRRRWSRRSGYETLEGRQLLAADPVLSELVALNTSTIQDEEGQYSDWLEIQNGGDATADLGGYYLTNDPQQLTRWRLPSASLSAGQSLVVFASGKDRRAGTLHTNFTLDELGGFLALVRPDGSTIASRLADYPALGRDQAYGSFRPSGDVALADGSDARVIVPASDSLGTGWTGGNEPFDDSTTAGWLRGAGPVGYDLQPVDTIQLDIQGRMYGRNGSAYLRYPFQVDRPEDLQALTLDLDFDDGYILYLNGQRIARRNAPTTAAFNSTAPDELGLIRSQVDLTPYKEYLRPGQNILAIHGLNARASDTEFLIDVQLTARGLQPETLGVLQVPTPGGLNGSLEPMITEFMAANGSTLKDEDGESSDWIELHNPGLIDVDLRDWYLTDNPDDLTGWRFPRTHLEAGQYLLVYASGKDRDSPGGPLHTDFRLSSDSDYLALVRPDGASVRWEYELGGQPYGQQFEDVSYGLRGSGSGVGLADPVEGLVGYWDFEEGSGLTAADRSGRGHTATLVNMSGISAWVPGRVAGKKALSFDGQNDFVSTPATASELGLPGGSPRTVAGWVKGPALLQGTNGGVFELGQNPSSRFGLRNTAPLGTAWTVEYGGTEVVSAGATTATWFHFAVRYDGERLGLYINGQLKKEIADAELTTDDLKPLTLGLFNNVPLLGQIDELAIWDMALPAASIASLASGTLTPRTVPTVNRWIGVDRSAFQVRQVNASPTFPGRVPGQIGGNDGSGANPLADADLLLSLPAGHSGMAADLTYPYDVINYYDSAVPADSGLFAQDEEFPLDLDLEDDDHFVLQATATLVIPAPSAGDFRFAVHSDEGSRLRIDGLDVILDNALHAPQLVTSNVVQLAAGTHTLELVYFERTGGAEVELLYASLTDGVVNGPWQLLGILPDLQPPLTPPSVLTADRVYFSRPTPGAANSDGARAFLGTVDFSHERGFYEAPFQLALSNRVPGVSIYYTLNGTEPSPSNSSASLYNGPLTISSTTVVRAKAFLADTDPSRTTTASYLFLSDIVRQSPRGETPADFPSSWGAHVKDYGMDPDIVNSATWGPRLKGALTQIPSISMVMNTNDLFGTSGIYSHPGSTGTAWERAASVELIDPDGSEDGFQVNAGVRIRGGFSRSADNPKHAFRFFFREEYGDSRLRYPLFGDEGADEFDKIDLRTTQNYSWAFGGDTRNTFLRDIFSRDLQGAMGSPYKRGEHYHLYINGQYWGLYQTDERIGADYGSIYFGGAEADYDVVHNNPRDNAAIDGTLDAYRRLWQQFTKAGGLSDANRTDYYRVQGMNLDGTRNSADERLLDVDNLIDYMIITYYTADSDGPGSKCTRPGLNNYFGLYNRVNPDGFKFFEHDSEHSLDTSAGCNNSTENMVEPLVNNGTNFNYFNPHWMHEQLANTNSDYRQRFIDRVNEVFADDGLLGDAHLQGMLQQRASEISEAIIGESARWGDAKRGTPLTKTDWDRAVQTTINWIRGRRAKVLDQLENVHWWPQTGVPALHPDSGTVAAGTLVMMDGAVQQRIEDDIRVNSSGLMRYIVPDAAFDQRVGDAWITTSFTNYTGWTTASGDFGYETQTGYQSFIKTLLPVGTTNVYMRGYSPFRVTDSDGDGSAADEYDHLLLEARYDDGFVAYLNGVPVLSVNAPPAPDYNALATAGHEASASYDQWDLGPEALALLKPSGNVLAVHLLNDSTASPDFLLGYRLIGRKIIGDPTGPDGLYYTLDGSDPRLSGGGTNPVAQKYENVPFAIQENTFVRGRIRLGNEWSPIIEAYYQVAPPSVAITEINYHPAAPTDRERAVLPTLDTNDFEFVEVHNHGQQPVNLAGMKLTSGVEFAFPSQFLQPGEYAVVVKNLEAFRLRYGQQVRVLGQFQSGTLSNGGERLELQDALAQPLISFGYGDGDPWPERADGFGATLVLIDSCTPAGQYDKADRWRGSTPFGGSPGAADPGPVGIVVNEVLSNPDLNQLRDAIELLNVSNGVLDLSGWYLSDAGGRPLKYRIPAGTLLAPGQSVVFDERHFNPTPATPGPDDFALSGTQGDDVWLVIPNSQSGVDRFVDSVHFGASEAGESWGRVPDGRGRLAPLNSVSLGGPNAAPRVGPLVISELHYNPAPPSLAALAVYPGLTADDLEFVELFNPLGAPLDLTDWRIRGGIDLDFDAGTVIPAGGTLVVVPFDPQDPANVNRTRAFRVHYGLTEQIPLFGGFAGQLDNDTERVELQRPGQATADTPPIVPRLQQDEVLYDDVAPWPLTADGQGAALHRRTARAYGNDGSSWTAAAPTPGTAPFAGGTPGDFDANGVVDVTDIDALARQLRSPSPDLRFDLNGDRRVNSADRDLLIVDILGSAYGDANLDGMFNSADIVLIFQAGEYEDSRPGNSTWAEGDWSSDGDFTSADLILAFQGGGYTSEAQIRHNSSTLSRISPATAAAIEGSNDSNRREYTSQEADRPSIRMLPAQIDFDRQAAIVSAADQPNDTLFQRDVNDWGLHEQTVDEIALPLVTERVTERGHCGLMI